MAEHEAMTGEGVAKRVALTDGKEGGGRYKVVLRVEREERRRQLLSYSLADQQFLCFVGGAQNSQTEVSL